MQQECGVRLVPKTNEVIYHLLGECIKMILLKFIEKVLSKPQNHV